MLKNSTPSSTSTLMVLHNLENVEIFFLKTLKKLSASRMVKSYEFSLKLENFSFINQKLRLHFFLKSSNLCTILIG